MSVLISDRKEAVGGVEIPLPREVLAEDDWFAQEARMAPPPTVITPAVIQHAVAVADEEDLLDPARLRILDGLLRMADLYNNTGALHQAIEMYFVLMREHEGTPQAEIALDRILDLAGRYEQSGELRQARAIYEQLL